MATRATEITMVIRATEITMATRVTETAMVIREIEIAMATRATETAMVIKEIEITMATRATEIITDITIEMMEVRQIELVRASDQTMGLEMMADRETDLAIREIDLQMVSGIRMDLHRVADLVNLVLETMVMTTELAHRAEETQLQRKNLYLKQSQMQEDLKQEKIRRRMKEEKKQRPKRILNLLTASR
jgi:hypothetical protein